MTSNLFIERVAAFYGPTIASEMQSRARGKGREPVLHDLHYVLNSHDKSERESAEKFYNQRLPSMNIREEDIVFA